MMSIEYAPGLYRIVVVYFAVCILIDTIYGVLVALVEVRCYNKYTKFQVRL